MEKMKWEIKRISEFTSVITGGTPSTSVISYWENGTIPWLNSGELNQDIVTNTSNYITLEGLKNSSSRLMPPNTVLIALTGATTGKSALLTFEACANQSVTGILPSNNHDPKYLYYYLSSQREKILNISWGGAQKHINQKYIKDFLIPLPPLPIQEKIAAILDKANNLRQKHRLMLEKYDQLAQSVFLEMFGDPSANPKKFPIGTIRDVVSEVKYGTSARAEENGKYIYLRMNNITSNGQMDFADLKYINIAKKDESKYLVRKGDLLFNRTNSKELVGKTAVFRENEPMVIAGYLLRVRTNEKANNEYISGYLNTIHGKMILKNMCKNIIGMANINAQEFQDISILIPSIQLQNNYALVVNEIYRQKSVTMQELQKAETLFQSIIQKAFNEDLTKN